jgi:hypothetical protein
VREGLADLYGASVVGGQSAGIIFGQLSWLGQNKGRPGGPDASAQRQIR